jgi:hypothetical protein
MICLNCGKHVNDRHWFRASGQPRCWDRYWTKEREYQLMGLWEQGLGVPEMARRLGKTEAAITLKCKRMGLGRRTHRAGMSAREVQRMLGFTCAKKVVQLIERGHLRGRQVRRQGPHLVWFIREHDLLAYLDDPAHWQDWDPDDITVAWLRRHVDQVRGDVRFLTLGQAGDRIGVDAATVGQWIDKGWLPVVRRMGTGNHLVRNDHVEQIAARYVYGDGAEGLVAA